MRYGKCGQKEEASEWRTQNRWAWCGWQTGRNGGMRLLGAICADMSDRGIDTLYLLMDHTSFYERYSWEFFCMAQGDGEAEPSRMYVHHQSGGSGR